MPVATLFVLPALMPCTGTIILISANLSQLRQSGDIISTVAATPKIDFTSTGTGRFCLFSAADSRRRI